MVEVESWTVPTSAADFFADFDFLFFFPSRQPWSTIAPEPLLPLRRLSRLRLPLERSRPSPPGVAVAVAPGVGVPTTVSTGEG